MDPAQEFNDAVDFAFDCLSLGMDTETLDPFKVSKGATKAEMIEARDRLAQHLRESTFHPRCMVDVAVGAVTKVINTIE